MRIITPFVCEQHVYASTTTAVKARTSSLSQIINCLYGPALHVYESMVYKFIETSIHVLNEEYCPSATNLLKRKARHPK